MKNPLHYQMTEYDCGPTSMLNGISFLFEREQIPPEIIRETMLYCMDCHGADGICGKKGTSCTAMMFLSNWYNNFAQQGQLPVECQYVRGEGVAIEDGSPVVLALRAGSAVVVRLWLDEPHYVLLTGLRDDGSVLMFDPYFVAEPFSDEVEFVHDHPFTYNRIVPAAFLNAEGEAPYALGERSVREGIILTNTALADKKDIPRAETYSKVCVAMAAGSGRHTPVSR